MASHSRGSGSTSSVGNPAIPTALFILIRSLSFRPHSRGDPNPAMLTIMMSHVKHGNLLRSATSSTAMPHLLKAMDNAVGAPTREGTTAALLLLLRWLRGQAEEWLCIRSLLKEVEKLLVELRAEPFPNIPHQHASGALSLKELSDLPAERLSNLILWQVAVDSDK